VDLNFPKYPFRIREENRQSYIFDELRKKFILLTPEEWVRQHAVKFLISERNYPASCIAIERKFTVNRLSKRFDALVFDTAGRPRMLVECKAPGVLISDAVMQQIAAYNLRFKVDYLLLSNGLRHLVCGLNPAKDMYEVRAEIPYWHEL
jgi:hypothetical protein